MDGGWRAEEMVGRRIGRDGRLVLERRIGHGATGAVWLARDERKDRPVAVKFLQPGAADDEALRRRFVREGKRFGRLRHENIVRVYQLGQDGGHLYLVIEYVEGRDLLELLQERGALEPREALRICHDVASGLLEAHLNNVVHRDLKPANVMIRDADAFVKVLDFGIAKDLTSQTGLTRVGMYVGTPAYSAPEQIAGEPLDHRADVFSLGMILYEMLTGPLDTEGRRTTEVMRATLRQDRVPLGDLYKRVGRPVARLIHRMTRRSPDRRPQDMEEVVTECRRLQELLSGGGAPEEHGGIRELLREIFEGP